MAGQGTWVRNPLVAKLLQFTSLSDEDARVLEPEVVVEPPRVVALDDEDRAAGATPAAERLGCLAGISLALVGLELRHLFHRYAGRV